MGATLSPLRITLALVALLGSTGCHHHGCDDDDDRGRGREGRRDRDRDDDDDDGDRCRRPCDNDNNNDNNNGRDAGPGTAVDTGTGTAADAGSSSPADVATTPPTDTGPRTPQGCFSDRDCAEGSVCRGGACRATCPNGTDAECLRVDVAFAYCGTDRLCTSQRP